MSYSCKEAASWTMRSLHHRDALPICRAHEKSNTPTYSRDDFCTIFKSNQDSDCSDYSYSYS